VNGEENIHVTHTHTPPPLVVVDLVGLAAAVSCSYITFAYEIAPNYQCRQYTTCDFSLLYPLKGLLPMYQYS
jgi:hypothetical protein